MRTKLAQVPIPSIGLQSARIAATLLTMNAYKNAGSISIYLSMPSGEAVTNDIVKDALTQHKAVFVPFIDNAVSRNGGSLIKAMKMDMVSLASIDDFERTEENRDRWGIPSVAPESVQGRAKVLRVGASTAHDSSGGIAITAEFERSAEATLDVVVMPGMAFDRNCGRLGHGKGYYDTFLEDYRDSKVGASEKAHFGLALCEQVLHEDETVPTNQDDWALDALVVGDGSIIERKPNIF
ncbi:uncharacterized protein KY384_003286 [Bacidia gigantensis]|uniref:uncharacterized protein n=1 Tax=Bacidia gigantensis TaxID=2732470 RepID=UPI001D04949F|nr:uncharacterized protein KY384_003286 [Bacidia gigantensis]KAG8531655.1 hypothetical protein KY384_003286 [Bacidia gigantensis]